MTTMLYYSLKDIENISWNLSNKDVPPDTLSLINSLSDKVAAPSYDKTPVFSNNNKNNVKKRKHKNNIINDDDWETIRNFQKTELIKSEGIQIEIDSIRALINKITEKTYDPVVAKLIEKIDSFDDSITQSEDINKIGLVILNMATSNRFNSKVYAKLCSCLSNKYEFMKNIINIALTDFMKLFDSIEAVDPNENYDKFCELNIINDNRRAMSLFLCNLYHNDFIEFNLISNILHELINRINNTKHELSHKMENDEIIESISIMASNCPIDNIKSIDNFENYVNEICQLNIKENLGISSKTKFKHMDIKTLLNK